MDKLVREIIYSPEYEAYYAGLDSRTKEKCDYVEHIIKTQDVVKKKYVKHLENTELYEVRVSLGSNEYRTILFAVDAASFMQATKILYLNSFLKKDTKQYKREISKAYRLLEKYMED
ncbi:type II toxin-antitoxin system RelE/ParE family toxin [Prevotella fusca]